MSDVKWIKITTDMFDDEKIKLIESMPDKDSILIIWIKLLVQAGKTNANGYVMLNENIPYTDEMLATIFSRPLNTVRLALKTFEDFRMIEIDDKGIYIENWSKHQNIEGLNKLKKNQEQNRLRQEKYRKKQKLLKDEKTGNVTVTLSNGSRSRLDLDKDIEIDLDKDQIHCPAKKQQDGASEKIPCIEIIDHLNFRTGSQYRASTRKTKDLIKARWNEGFRLNDFKTVIDKKCVEWMNDEKMEKFLRPPTLFGPKFESYLNQLSVKAGRKQTAEDRYIKALEEERGKDDEET